MFLPLFMIASFWCLQIGFAANPSESKSLKFSGRIEPEGSYQVYIQPAAEENSLFAPRDGKTDPSGNFKFDISESDSVFWNAKKFVVRIIPSEQQAASKKSVTRILRTRIEPGKNYLLRYGAIRPIIKKVLSSDGKTEKESGRFYLLAYLLGAPDTVGEDHGIRMKIKQSFCQIAHPQGPADVIDVDPSQIWIFPKSAVIDELQMWVDMRVVADTLKCVIDGKNGQKVIDGDKIPDQNLNLVEEIQLWLRTGDQKEAFYHLRQPVFSGADGNGKRYNFFYKLSFADQRNFVRAMMSDKKKLEDMTMLEREKAGLVEASQDSAMLSTLSAAWEAHQSDKNNGEKSTRDNDEDDEDDEDPPPPKDAIADVLPPLNEEQLQLLFDDAVERQAVRAEYNTGGGFAKFILRIVRSYCTVFKALARVSPFGPLLAPLIVGCEDSVKMCTFCALSAAEKKDPNKKPKLSTDSLVEGLKRMVDGFKKVWAEIKMDADEAEGIANWTKRINLLIKRINIWLNEKREKGLKWLYHLFSIIKWFFFDRTEENPPEYQYEAEEGASSEATASSSKQQRRHKRGDHYGTFYRNCPGLGVMLRLCEDEERLKSTCVYDVLTVRARAMGEMDALVERKKPDSALANRLKMMLRALSSEEVGWTIFAANTVALLVSWIVSSTGKFSKSESFDVLVPGMYEDKGRFSYGMSHGIITRRWISDWQFITNPHMEVFTVSHHTPAGSLVWGSALIGAITIYLSTFVGYTTVCQGTLNASAHIVGAWFDQQIRRLPSWERYGWAAFGGYGNDDRTTVYR